MGRRSMRDGWEILADFHHLNSKATRMLRAMVDAVPEGRAVVTHSYTGARRCLMLYGPGSPLKLPSVQRHIKRGGRVAMWDLAYWERRDSMRLAIDSMHPTPEQIAASPAHGRRQFLLREDANPSGPILLIGLGPKSIYAYGTGQVQTWERAKLADLRLRYPGREIIWRPKGRRPFPLAGLRMSHGDPIEDALRGCSLLVCRHSNTAVDACIAGVPVECEDGAALALYRGNPAPSREQRADFLARLTYWEWSRFEAAAAWSWIEKVIS